MLCLLSNSTCSISGLKTNKQHGWPQNTDNLDMSEGPRYCNKCDYQAKDGKNLDAHTWSEHTDDDEEIKECSLESNHHSFGCNIYEEKFDTKRDLMNHKKKQHYDRVAMCWRFAFAYCSYADTDCYFRHCQTAQVTESSTVNCSAWSKLNTEIGLHTHPPPPPPTTHHKLLDHLQAA